MNEETLTCGHCKDEFPKSDFVLDCSSEDIAMWIHKKCYRSTLEVLR